MFSHFGSILSSLSDSGIVISGLKMTQTTSEVKQSLQKICKDFSDEELISRLES